MDVLEKKQVASTEITVHTLAKVQNIHVGGGKLLWLRPRWWHLGGAGKT